MESLCIYGLVLAGHHASYVLSLWRNPLDRQVMFPMKRQYLPNVDQGLLLKLLRDVPPAQVHDVLLEAVAV